MPPESCIPHSTIPTTVSTPETPMAAFRAAPPQARSRTASRSARRPAALAASRAPSLKSICVGHRGVGKLHIRHRSALLDQVVDGGVRSLFGQKLLMRPLAHKRRHLGGRVVQIAQKRARARQVVTHMGCSPFASLCQHMVHFLHGVLLMLGHVGIAGGELDHVLRLLPIERADAGVGAGRACTCGSRCTCRSPGARRRSPGSL